MNWQTTRALAGSLAALTAAGINALGGTVNYNFDQDPSGILELLGGATYNPSGGNPETGGYLSLTDAGSGQRSAIVFNDFDSGLVVKAFSFSMDVRIGGGTETPADGFSINYMRSNDPVIAGGSGSEGYGLTGYAASPGGEGNLPEEGSTTGLGIGFDAYNSGSGDVVGISVRLDNTLIAQYSLSTLNGVCTNATSLQTGPRDVDNPGSAGLLCWQPFSVNLGEDGKLVIRYKNVEITPAGGLQTTFAPSPGRLVLVARTGDLNQNQHIDNIQITTIPATLPTAGNVTGGPASFSFDLTDAGTTSPNTNTLKVALNGTLVTPAVTRSNTITSVSYNGYPTLLAPNSTNTVSIGFLDSNGNTNSIARTFVVGSYSIVPTAFAAPAGAVNTSQPGFKIRTYQTQADNLNNLAISEKALAGLLGDNVADTSLAGADGYFDHEAVINFTKDPAADGKQGSFGDETPVPGLPGTYTGGADVYEHVQAEILTYLQFPAAGIYTMAVDSDDGFRVTTARTPKEKFGLVLGEFNGGRGSGSPTVFTFVVTQAGFYPFRLIWQNGGGGCNVEWYSVLADGTKVLVNDTATPGSIRAYRASSVTVPYVDLVNPFIGETGIAPNLASIRAELVNGTTLTVAPGATLSLNGTALTPTATTAAGRTTVTAPVTGLLASGATNTAVLVYSDSAANKFTNAWTFFTVNYATLPTALSSPLGSGDATKPGFRVKTHQIDLGFQADGSTVHTAGTPTTIGFTEGLLAGLFGPNVADLTGAVGGYFEVPGVINFVKDPVDVPQGNFGDETVFPGIPGTPVASSAVEQFGLEIQTYVEFPTAGVYQLGFNSDDGFRVTAAEAASANYTLSVVTPAAVAGPVAAVTGGSEAGGIAQPLPLPPITARVVLADPANGSTPLVNAAAIAGNIALIERGVNAFTDKIINAANAGAVAVIIANNRDAASAEGVLPFVMGGNAAPLPAVMVPLATGQMLKTNLAAGTVTATLGQDTAIRLGEFDSSAGRGASDTIFSVYVPTAGVYPLRAVYNQGGGGGSAEWFSVTPTGTKILLNDTANPSALKAYRARTGSTPPTVAIAGSGIVTFTGTLQASPTLNGTYTNVTGATSPYTVTNATTTFFRSSR